MVYLLWSFFPRHKRRLCIGHLVSLRKLMEDKNKLLLDLILLTFLPSSLSNLSFHWPFCHSFPSFLSFFFSSWNLSVSLLLLSYSLPYFLSPLFSFFSNCLSICPCFLCPFITLINTLSLIPCYCFSIIFYFPFI